MLRKITSIDFQSNNNTSQCVLIRVDFNVPVENDIVSDDYRILKSLPTIQHCLDEGAKIVLMSHRGRPNGKVDNNLSLMPAGERLAQLLEMPIKFSHDCISEDAIDVSRNLKSGEIHLLENLRFYDEEISNDTLFASKLAQHGSIYLNDAFGTAHREHASNTGITKYFTTKGMGLLVEKEMAFLSENISDSKGPVSLIIGGAKIDTKISVIKHFFDIADNILIGGAMANTFLAANKYDMGKSLVQKDEIETAKKLMLMASKSKTNIILPIDFNGELNTFGSGKLHYATIENIKKTMICEDIGELSINLFTDIIEKSKTVFWNGTVGVAENKDFAKGTTKIIDTIVDSDCNSIVGGGDTVAAIRNYKKGIIEEFSHASTGGGSCLELLSGNKLPAIEMLKK
ncbi:MAG: phosphoglycerate kinase [Candidatus Marinimicrobia bacterium]|jgi:3-phosphoglycerate kinase|nr:phosphoglycerate kinase [Candidatus Neomarinimicrobiota bacterium]MDG1268806.1 phosphoglycerate kinase [Candidatus Neomarinimicrobiota bacterium]|tara:strand:+ start:1828 stop:3027 length:1200 start_codon:yes stop_codon:yes gene_type:complete